MSYRLEETPELMAVWPDCSVPGCRRKVWLGGEEPSEQCCPHTLDVPFEPRYQPSEDEHRRRYERLMALLGASRV